MQAVTTGAGEGGVIGDTVFQAQVAEPSIGQVDLNLPAKLALRSDGEHLSDDQHPDHRTGSIEGRQAWE
jgi:hypothetical protein